MTSADTVVMDENLVERLIDLLWEEFERYVPDGEIHPHQMRAIAQRIVELLTGGAQDDVPHAFMPDGTGQFCRACGWALALHNDGSRSSPESVDRSVPADSGGEHIDGEA